MNEQSRSLFEEETTLESLSKMGNVLEFVSGVVDFELFRLTLEKSLQTQERKGNAGRQPIDPMLLIDSNDREGRGGIS